MTPETTQAPQEPVPGQNDPAMPGAQPMPPEVMENLETQFEQISGEMERVESQRMQGTASGERMRQEALQSLLGVLVRLGVNPDDPATVQAFVQELQENDPDKAKVLERLLTLLAPKPQAAVPAPVMQGEPAEETGGELPLNDIDDNEDPQAAGTVPAEVPPDLQ